MSIPPLRPDQHGQHRLRQRQRPHLQGRRPGGAVGPVQVNINGQKQFMTEKPNSRTPSSTWARGNDTLVVDSDVKVDINANGGSGNDLMVGGSGNDDLHGGTGNDAIFGRGGNDHIDGGTRQRLLSGGNGNDHIDGGRGNDHIYAGNGNDMVHAGRGNDYVNGGNGQRLPRGGQNGNDHIDGGAWQRLPQGWQWLGHAARRPRLRLEELLLIRQDRGRAMRPLDGPAGASCPGHRLVCRVIAMARTVIRVTSELANPCDANSCLMRRPCRRGASTTHRPPARRSRPVCVPN